jgi:tetratricopeptide (TPR) repeat protein
MSNIAQLKEFIKDSPKDSFLLYALALEHVKIKEYDEAINIFQMLIEEDEEYLATYYQYANILAELGQTNEAEVIYKKGIEIASQQNKIKTKQELEQDLFLLD